MQGCDGPDFVGADLAAFGRQMQRGKGEITGAFGPGMARSARHTGIMAVRV